MKYLLKAKIVQEMSNPIEVEADSLEDAKELIIDSIESCEIEVEGTQSLNIEFEQDCPASVHGHRRDWSNHEKIAFCKHCGISLEDYGVITL